MKVELTDIVFAVDSILVAVAMSQKPWVVLTGGILGIIAMRLVIGQLLSIVERYPILVDGAFVIIAWVGFRLLVQYLHQMRVIGWEVPEWLGFGLIVVIFGAALAWAMLDERRQAARQGGVVRRWARIARATSAPAAWLSTADVAGDRRRWRCWRHPRRGRHRRLRRGRRGTRL